MYIEIEFPDAWMTLVGKIAYFQSIYDWGVENLDDQEAWKYVFGVKNTIRATTAKLELYIENESDAMAIKLTWS